MSRKSLSLKFSFTWTIADVEAKVTVTGNWTPGSPGCMYQRNGDPGDPPEPSEFEDIEIVSIENATNGVKAEIDRLLDYGDDKFISHICELADEEADAYIADREASRADAMEDARQEAAWRDQGED